MDDASPQEDLRRPPPLAELSKTGVVIVDHGSRRRESNDLLLQVVLQYASVSPYAIVEPAHMELAEPSIKTAFARCVEQGAELVVVHPYFLLPGRHWAEDIPRLAAAAAACHAGTSYLVTAPLGLHPLITDVIGARVDQCLARATGQAEACPLCEGTDKCEIR